MAGENFFVPSNEDLLRTLLYPRGGSSPQIAPEAQPALPAVPFQVAPTSPVGRAASFVGGIPQRLYDAGHRLGEAIPGAIGDPLGRFFNYLTSPPEPDLTALGKRPLEAPGLKMPKPASGNYAAAKAKRGEPVQAEAPQVPVKAPPEPSSSGSSVDQKGKASAGTPVYTNADLDRYRQSGGGAVSTFTNPQVDSEARMQQLFGRALELADARLKSRIADPTGIGDYTARKKVDEEFSSRVDRDILQRKEAANAEFQRLHQAIASRTDKTPEEKQAALDDLQQRYTNYVSTLDPRFKGQ